MVGSTIVNIDSSDATVHINMSEKAQVRGKISVEKSDKLGIDALNLRMEPQSGIGTLMGRDTPQIMMIRDGSFTISQIMPGSYLFILEDENLSYYLKEVECGGTDYTVRPVEIEVGTKLDCRVTVSQDVGNITGAVSDGDKPLPGLYVIAIPQSRTLRENPQYTSTEKTDADGHFEMKVIPGDYFLFAVRPNDQDSYYALDFAERNLPSAERVSVKPGDTRTVPLKPTSPQ